MVNPNYPVVEELWGPAWTAAGASLPATKWVNLIDRTLSQASARRGKQYELDQPQAGEYSIVLGSQDGALDPTNTGGPYGGKILPYQPYRRRAQWPPTANVFDGPIATGGEGFTAGSFPASFNVTVPSGSIAGSVAVLGAGNAWQGTNVFSFAIANGTGINSGILKMDTPAIRPGKKFTFSVFLSNTTASTSTNVIAYIAFLNADGSQVFGNGSNVTLVGASGTPSWQRLSVTATAPTTGAVYGLRVGLNVGATTTAASTIVADGFQGEWASAATTWVSPGTWYPLFSGFTERWPSQWAEGGTYGQVNPTAVDTFALLSQVQLKEIFLEEIDSHAPRFCYTLADAAGSTAFADMTGNLPPAPLVSSKAGTGGWTAGNSVTSASATGAYTGATGTVVNASPINPGSATAGSATMLSLADAGIKGPATSTWTRMIAFRYTHSSNPADISVIWESRKGDDSFQSHCKLYIDSGGGLILLANANGADPAFSRLFLGGGANMTDGNWHLLSFGFDGTSFRYSLDGVASTSSNSGPPTLGAYADYVGASYFPTTRTAFDAFKGDLAFVTEFPSLLSESDMNALFTAWKNAATGESSSARYARILRYSGYTGPSSIGTGMTSSMGPAVDLGGADVMSALNGVVETENGEHYVAADGTIVFRGRNVRYNALIPVLTFGDGSGELPFEDLQLDFDSTHLSNVVTVTQMSTGTTYSAQDSASIAAYYTRTMSRSLNTSNASECQDAANYFVSRYKGPLTRVQSIKLHPSAAPSLWPSLLTLELGTRVRINRRPVGAPTVTVDCFVEQIQWDMDGSGEAFVTLQCSPIDPVQYAQFSDTLPQFDQAVFAY
ncbi:hypothetical protein ACFVYV_09385 [Streptomyces mirabilis]|uniref:hypothetical protein n=1 Tax=Streptomyces mirabilis TaxID=68239 RepID=UPI0036D9F248